MHSRPVSLFLSLLLAFAALPVAHSTAMARDELLDEIDFARENVYPALVNISVVARSFSGGRTQRFPAAGSGVIVSAGGHVLTNFHVAGNTTQIHCTLPSGEVIEADVVAHDPLSDLSVLKLRLEKRTDPGRPLPFSTLGDSDALGVGEYVLAMGNPLTLSSSLTLGVVSNPSRVFTDFTGTAMDELDLGEGEVTGVFTRWIQHDALILPGNSGGPLVNLKGKIVGINELGGGGVGFAIPSNLAAKVLNQVMTYGEVRRGWIGCSVLPVSKLGRARGALISSLVPSSPAAAAGLQAGDVLVSLDGEPTNVRFFDQVPTFHQRISELPVDQPVEVRYERNGETKTATITVARLEKYLGEPAEHRELGITVRAITTLMALSRRLPSTEGVLVTGVRAGYPCQEAKPPVEYGDVIVAVAGKKITGLADFGETVADFGAGAELVLTIYREEESLLTVVKGREKKKKERSKELPKAWLGVRTQVLTPPVAKALGFPDLKGFRVSRVLPWTEAEKAGLQPGDVITQIDDVPLKAFRAQDAEDLRRAVENLTIGGEAVLAVHRGGQDIQIKVALEKTPPAGSESETVEQKEFEFQIRDIVFLDRIENRWTREQQGVLVTDVTSGGWAQVAGLRAGDLLMSAGGHQVSDAAGFETALKEIIAAKPKTIPIFVLRAHRTHFVFIEPTWERGTGTK